MTRAKAIRALAALQALFALALILAPKLVFPVCDSTMHCYYSYMAEIGTASALIAASAGMLVSRGMEAPRMLGMVGLVLSAFVILYPSWLIGVCGSPRMACHYGLMPVWNLAGGGLVIINAVITLIAKEDKV